MPIRDVTATVLGAPEYPHGGWVLVRVRTDDGIEGLGECFVPDSAGKGVFAVKDLIDYSLKRAVIGADVLDIEMLWEKMYAIGANLYDRRGLLIHAISGMDMALYDAAGKTLHIPVHKLLGGGCRDRVRVYVSSVYVDSATPQVALDATVRYVAQGFTAIKYYGWPDFGHDLKHSAALLVALRQAAGEGVDLMLDLGRPRSVPEAIRVARMIEDSGARIYWWEEPLDSSDDAEGLARLSAATTVPIAAGEREMTAFAFRELILKRAVGLLQPDLSWVGGITEGKRIAELARLFNVNMVPHNWGMMLNTAASIHLVASMPRGFLCEYPITPRVPEEAGSGVPSPMMAELAQNPICIENGYALVPQGPGLGIELDEEAVQRYTRVL
jgi:L-rhamnonate dehydratase